MKATLRKRKKFRALLNKPVDKITPSDRNFLNRVSYWNLKYPKVHA